MIEKKQIYQKSPTEEIDFGINWTALLKTGETITQSLWIAPSPIDIALQQIVGNITVCYISGGTLDTRVEVFNKITTSLGAVYERFIVLEIENIQA